MRLLHVSDWHIGRQTYRCSRVPDHEAALAEIIDLARDTRPHLVLHTGDVFDGFRPGYAEMAFAVEALEELAALAPVVVVAGNHDSPALFRLFDRLQGPDPRIRFVDRIRPPAEGGVLDLPGGDGEVVRIAFLPFVHANRMVDRFEDATTWTATYSERIQRIEEELERGLAAGYDPSRHVLLFAAHLYVSGARYSGSERPLHVSDAYATRLRRLPNVSYAAFGHIHLPQPLPRRVTGRYAGSPIPLDFGEERQHQGVVLVEAEPGQPAVVTPVALEGGRPLRTIVGTPDEVRAAAPSVGDALCRVTICTGEPRPSDLRDARPGGRGRGDRAASGSRRAPPRAGAGLVRPRLLRVKGLRSFRAEREIDFADLGLVAVVGDTGAGKSSILEAITYALYNATTWDQRGVKQLISDGATTMSVELEFTVDGHVWRIARSTSRGAYPPPSHQLECLTDPTVPPLDSEDAINAEVARLVGLDWGGFTSAVILPQGRFQTLLQASPADRTEILKGIFRLGELAEAREQARELAFGYRGPLDDLQAERARLLPDPAASAREARRRKQEAEQEERHLRAVRAELARQEKAAAREEREARRAEAAAERLARANVRPARELRRLEPLLREVEAPPGQGG